MFFGMQAAKSVVLSRIARKLREDILLKKTEERLSRHLLADGLEKRVHDEAGRARRPREADLEADVRGPGLLLLRDRGRRERAVHALREVAGARRAGP